MLLHCWRSHFVWIFKWIFSNGIQSFCFSSCQNHYECFSYYRFVHVKIDNDKKKKERMKESSAHAIPFGIRALLSKHLSLRIINFDFNQVAFFFSLLLWNLIAWIEPSIGNWRRAYVGEKIWHTCSLLNVDAAYLIAILNRFCVISDGKYHFSFDCIWMWIRIM